MNGLENLHLNLRSERVNHEARLVSKNSDRSGKEYLTQNKNKKKIHWCNMAPEKFCINN